MAVLSSVPPLMGSRCILYRSLATWLNPRKKRSLHKDKDYLQRVELIEDLRFETATTRLKARPDGYFLIASGGLWIPAGEDDQEVTAIELDEDGGFQIAVERRGERYPKPVTPYYHNKFEVLIYDLRSSNPIRFKDHMYESPILGIKWHRTLNSQGFKLITADNHIVESGILRRYSIKQGEGMTGIEPTGGAVNDICVFRESGLMLLALGSSVIPSYFIPALGPAPMWCSYLENRTEEMEENTQTTIYDDYKFVCIEEIERLNLTNLIGTNVLRAYMNGFFINYALYKGRNANSMVVQPGIAYSMKYLGAFYELV